MTQFWLFGYGSIIWKTGFKFETSMPAAIANYERRFWQASTDHRGTPEIPGRVVTLIPSPGSVCWGLAYLIDRSKNQSVLADLDYREKGGYERVATEITFRDKRKAPALTYIAPASNPQFLGDAALSEIAHQIVQASGPSGDNVSYVYSLDKALLKYNIHDPHVSEVTHAIKMLMDKKT